MNINLSPDFNSRNNTAVNDEQDDLRQQSSLRARDNDASFAQDQEQTASFLNRVYGLMTCGLLLTAFIAHYTYINVSPEQVITWVKPAIIAEFIVVLALSFLCKRLPAILSILGFIAYAALNGFTLSVIFYAYQLGSITSTFVACSTMYGAMTLYGFFTKRDLTSFGNLCIMGLFGLVAATLINFFLHSTGLQLIVSYFGVAIFLGLTAYDAQKIKALNEAGCNHFGIAVLAALEIYLDFINLYLYLLQLFGKRK